MNMVDEELEQVIKDRIADRYTAAELCEILDVPVEDIIAEYWTRICLSRVLREQFDIEEEEVEEDE